MHADFQKIYGTGVYAMFLKAGYDIPKIHSYFMTVDEPDKILIILGILLKSI
jgi:hypothetical protein